MVKKIDKLNEEYRKSNSLKFYWHKGRVVLIVALIALLIYFGPALILFGSFALTEISSKVNSNHNITEIINDPQKKGAEISKSDENLTLSWDIHSDSMIKVKNASSKDIERLAKSVYSSDNYDRCAVERQKSGVGSKVTFYKKDKLVYTVVFNGN